MRIVIDMQAVQGSNRQHGIGRYTLSLAQAMVRNRGSYNVCLALNGLFPDTIEPIRSVFDGLLPQENIRVWQAPGPVCSAQSENDWRRNAAELIREAFLASLNPDVVLVSSLFEGPRNDAVTSIGRLGCTLPTAVILYDLIPLTQRHLYLENPVDETWYENKLDHLRRADLLLAISEWSRRQGMRYLGFSPEMCVNISAAAGPQFQPQRIDSRREQEIRKRYGLNRPFVMYTGGIDPRKNIEGLIRAYANQDNQLRAKHQLAIVCANLSPSSRAVLEALARKQGLKSDEMVLTGFVAEEDLLTLYQLCKVFVFPSWEEGFGLPALEAMSCGRAVIGSNASSLPQVIGRKDALFDPTDDMSITDKLSQVLINDAFRLELEQHGLEQARQFSWDSSAQRAFTAIEMLHERKLSQPMTDVVPARRPRLAYISPLRPVRSGISDYSAELLPELSRHYDIDVIVEQEVVSCSWVNANCPVRNVEWFRAHADQYDRVLYHFGNNYFHLHMIGLLESVPGIVVLHDFFLSGLVGHMHFSNLDSTSWVENLYRCHGYAALKEHFDPGNTTEVPWRYPCNQSVLQLALSVIVHSENSRRLARQWYGENSAANWTVVPHLRAPEYCIDRAKARQLLKLDRADFVVCSFGVLGPHKLNHRLLNAWLASSLAREVNCVLIFVGESLGGQYGAELIATIRQSGLADRIRITGWVDSAKFRRYLAATDIAVQLRALSRGETSGTALDCMNFGLPTIVNEHGSMADLPDDGVWKLPDQFDQAELVGALETLWRDSSRRQQLGARAREIVLTCHAPQNCAKQYAQAIETAYRSAVTKLPALTRAIAEIETVPSADSPDWVGVAESMALSIEPRFDRRQLLVDISELARCDSRSGIQRVVRSILQELLAHPPERFRVEPIYATPNQGYRYARHFTLQFLGCPASSLADDPIDYLNGDLFLGLDLQPQVVSSQQAVYQQLRNHGVQVQFVVYDLLPITLSKAFSQAATKAHHAWLSVVAESDGAICISKAVAAEFKDWLMINGPVRHRPLQIKSFHLGADIVASCPSKGIPQSSKEFLNALADRPSFLMVGTLEPRKGHIQALAAFEKLWADDLEVNLVIVGKEGWMVESLTKKFRRHPYLGKYLHWLEGISDEYLEKIYGASSALLAASEGEGFGLPLIEAARHKLPIIARDIPVFREVASDHAFYFSGNAPQDLTAAIKEWLDLYARGEAPSSNSMPWITWHESTQQLLDVVVHKKS